MQSHLKNESVISMKFVALIMLIFLKILHTENRMLPYNNNYETIEPRLEIERAIKSGSDEQDNSESEHEKVIGLRTEDERDIEYETEKSTKKPCAIVVLSSVQNPSMQSLLRKYRYNANGILIPSSVKYFVKLPQGLRDSPLIVPLNDKAFSPSGGFVRYYKEVPPIPYSWL